MKLEQGLQTNSGLAEKELQGNSAVDGSGDTNYAIVDSAGRLQTRGFRLADGTGARMLVDADRHGQIDVLTSALPAGASTEATLQEVKTAIEAISGLQRSTDMEGGGIVAVGVTAVEMTFTGTPETIIISAVSSNTGTIYIGKSNVTTAGANAICFLLPGESMELAYNDTTNALYAVASVAAQSVVKGALI